MSRRKELTWYELEKILQDNELIFKEERISNITLANPKKILIDTD